MRLAAAITLCIGVLLAALFRYGSAPEQPPVAGAENERPASSDLQAPELAYARVLIDPPSAPTEPTEPGDVTADKPGWYSHQDPIERLQTILGIYHEKRASGDPVTQLSGAKHLVDTCVATILLYQGRQLPPKGPGKTRIPKGGTYMIAIGERFLVKAGEFPLFDRTHRDFKAARKDRTPFAGGAIDEDLHERILELFSEAHAWLDADR